MQIGGVGIDWRNVYKVSNTSADWDPRHNTCYSITIIPTTATGTLKLTGNGYMSNNMTLVVDKVLTI